MAAEGRKPGDAGDELHGDPEQATPILDALGDPGADGHLADLGT